MAIHSLNSLEMPLLASAFSSALPHAICGQPAGRECATQLFNNCRGARLMGIRATGARKYYTMLIDNIIIKPLVQSS